jgi:hypothetical protein
VRLLSTATLLPDSLNTCIRRGKAERNNVGSPPTRFDFVPILDPHQSIPVPLSYLS